jgi:Flp pilus assembly protein TadG
MRPVPNRRDRGQAAVELALSLPLVALVTLGIVQVIVVGRGQVAVELAARDAARAAAVAADPSSAARAAALRATTLRPLDVTVSTSGDAVTVTVTHVDPTDVAIVGTVIGDVRLAASVTMVREPP